MASLYYFLLQVRIDNDYAKRLFSKYENLRYWTGSSYHSRGNLGTCLSWDDKWKELSLSSYYSNFCGYPIRPVMNPKK